MVFVTRRLLPGPVWLHFLALGTALFFLLKALFPEPMPVLGPPNSNRLAVMAESYAQMAGTLPTGYLKRLELGRCLALRPELIICDEVFSGLSASEISSLVPLIEKINAQGITMIMIEHRLAELFRVANRVMALSYGVKVTEGEPLEVIDHPKVREAYLGSEEGFVC